MTVKHENTFQQTPLPTALTLERLLLLISQNTKTITQSGKLIKHHYITVMQPSKPREENT